MKILELRKLDLKKLEEQLIKLKKSALDFRFKMKSGNVTNFVEGRFLRKDIARVKTVINEKKNKGDK